MATKATTPKPAAKSASLKQKPVAAKTEVAVRKPSSGAVVSIKDALKAQAAAIGERTQPASGNRIRTKGKNFILPDGSEAASLDLIIVDFTTVHKFYEGNYDPKNITPPACFAIGTNPRQMTPSDNSPNLQADSCQGCPMNEFGSAGNGKACKNGRLLAVLPPDADDKSEMWTLEVSPTAIKGFDGYVASVARQFGMPPVSVVTTVSLDESVDYAKLVFSNPTPNERLEIAYARQAEAQELLSVEPDVSGYKPPAPVGRPAAKKAAPARR